MKATIERKCYPLMRSSQDLSRLIQRLLGIELLYPPGVSRHWLGTRRARRTGSRDGGKERERGAGAEADRQPARLVEAHTDRQEQLNKSLCWIEGLVQGS